MNEWDFAGMTLRVIERDGFSDFQPVAVFPARAHIAVLAGIPDGVSHEDAALDWANPKALEANDEEYLVAFKVDEAHFKVLRVVRGRVSARVFKADGSDHEPQQ